VLSNWQYPLWPGGERYGKENLNNSSQNEYYVPRFGDVVCDYDNTMAWKNTYAQGTGIDSKVTRIHQGGRKHLRPATWWGRSASPLRLRERPGDQCEGPMGRATGRHPPERYSGEAQRESDTESGLVHMRARQYDPRLAALPRRIQSGETGPASNTSMVETVRVSTSTRTDWIPISAS